MKFQSQLYKLVVIPITLARCFTLFTHLYIGILSCTLPGKCVVVKPYALVKTSIKFTDKTEKCNFKAPLLHFSVFLA